MARRSTILTKYVIHSVIALISLGAAVRATQAGNDLMAREWELIRTVSNPYGGVHDLVLIPEYKQRDREYYLSVSNEVCVDRTSCMVDFWTDRTHIPSSASMPVSDLGVMTASYERNPRYKTPVLRLACWLYPSREIAELNNCAYWPGAKVPWKSPSEDSIRRYQ
jgi:hypothetical protein